MATRFRHLLPVVNRLAASAAAVDLNQVGRDACLSPARAQRVFTAIVGESPKRYQQRVRLQRAAALLLGSDARIVDIAIASGFESHESFTRAFGRRFGTSPSHYRRKHDRWSGPQPVRTVSRIAPCIGLFGRSLDVRPGEPVAGSATASSSQPNTKREHPSNMEQARYDIERTSVEATPILFGTRRLDRAKIADGLAEVLPAAFGYAMAEGLAMAGPPFVRYIDQSPAFLTVEAGVPLVDDAPAPPPESGLSVGRLPAGPVAVTVHKGPYETLGQAHIALDRWMAEEGVVPAGAVWEIYLTDPAEVPDPADWLTELRWPISG